MDNGSDVIILSEHWLWPFEMHKLKEINPEFAAECVTDSRLNETSSLTRGCGGVGILWKKSFDVTPIGEIDSDRICGIRMRLTYPETKELTILGVYSPCADAGIEKYVQVLCELEHLISEGQRLGPVLVGGDFNAHLVHLEESEEQESQISRKSSLLTYWTAVKCMHPHFHQLPKARVIPSGDHLTSELQLTMF